MGGTWLKAAVVDTTRGTTTAYAELPSRSHEGPGAILSDIAKLYAFCGPEAKNADVIGVALGGGPVDPLTGRVLGFTAGIEGWEDFGLTEELSRRLNRPAHLENDANAAALAEWHFGASQIRQVLVYITWSTGISAGLVIRGELFRGAFGTAAELGHVPLGHTTSLCACGGTGCLESLVAGRYNSGGISQINKVTPGASEPGLIDAMELWDRAFRTVVNLFGPDLVVIGGGVATAYAAQLEGAWHRARVRFLPPMRSRTSFAISTLGKKNTLLGAALAAEAAFTSKRID